MNPFYIIAIVSIVIGLLVFAIGIDRAVFAKKHYNRFLFSIYVALSIIFLIGFILLGIFMLQIKIPID